MKPTEIFSMDLDPPAAPKPKKKRKADEPSDEPKKAKKEKKETFSDPNVVLPPSKTKAVAKLKEIDLDRQCGVISENGNVCARSLTCKNHSLAAKKAVIGRTQAFEILLQIHQSKNLTKPKGAFFHRLTG